ncbi:MULTISPECIES: cortex morphogenetic protein CmpA [Peribacillus]|nr:cortex morphogenetic protein CmpA [Peribacillus asahii]RID81614.1 cortex morphogenetic protein CmpA [Peribacillus asahii]USK61894.1 cortex morphogenetic protein CmpA [Peribacillus asahii]USK72359.1 cortex morphogenetic protein CmpA [Peribacillus asahii]USK87205.1 cortex morphogenetic protein CmpA [Peribacillus asahii]
MPKWFQNQMRRAFFEKDSSQIKMLNRYWFLYQRNDSLRS